MLRLAVIAAIGILSAVSATKILTDYSAAHAAAPAAPAQPVLAAVAADPDAAPASVLKGPDGHYWAEATVDGARVRFLVDTGASAVSLTGADARRLGMDTDTLVYDVPVHTANGDGLAARVHLGSVSVAGARLKDVDAMVVDKGLSTSLLGMSFLGRLSRFEATPSALILRP